MFLLIKLIVLFIDFIAQFIDIKQILILKFNYLSNVILTKIFTSYDLLRLNISKALNEKLTIFMFKTID